MFYIMFTGIDSRLSHFTDLDVEVIWLPSIIIDQNDPAKLAAKYGTHEDFKSMANNFKKAGELRFDVMVWAA